MSETAAEYDPRVFPFAGVYMELTEKTQAVGYGPVEAYVEYEAIRRRERLTPCPDYGSTAMTTAGHNRNPAMERSEGMARNITTARSLAVAMHNQGSLDARALILPVDFGYIPGWQQSDYMQLWLLTCAGVRFEGPWDTAEYLRNFEQALSRDGCDVDIMNNSSLDLQTRAQEYFRFAGACAFAARAVEKDHHPVRKIVSLVDGGESLGGRTEVAFGKIMGIPVYETCAVGPAQNVEDALPTYDLKRDVADIVRFGGTVCQIARGSTLVCVRSDTAAAAQP